MNEFIAPVELRKSFRLINHGPTVLVSAFHDGVDNVMAAAWVCALDYAPPKITVVLDKSAATRALVEKSGEFVIQVPNAAQLRLSEPVAPTSHTEDAEKLRSCGVKLARLPDSSRPFVDGCSAWLACRLIPE